MGGRGWRLKGGMGRGAGGGGGLPTKNARAQVPKKGGD